MPRAQVVVPRSIVVAAFAALVSTGGLEAQVRQYTPPGGGREAVANRKEAVEKAVDESRWHAGPLRLDPAFWISDLSWVDSPSEGIDSDLTARAGAGLRAYLPVGSRSTLAAYALPEYVWWRDRDEERRVNQRFGVGSFTYFNRLAIEATARRDEDFTYATAESFQKVTMRTDELALDLDVPIFRSLSLHARGADRSYESLSEEPGLADTFAALDRDDTEWQAGIRFHLTSDLFVGGGVGHSESRFAEEAENRDNSGDTWYAEIGVDRPKLVAHLEYEQNDLVGDPGSAFGKFDGWTGDAGVEWRPRDTYALRLYGSRSLAYSLGVAPGYVDESYGIGTRLGLGWRFDLDLFTETGKLRYEQDLAGFRRTDDVRSLGASLTCKLGEHFQVGVAYRKSTIDSDFAFADRELEEIRGTLAFGLSSGSAGWF